MSSARHGNLAISHRHCHVSSIKAPRLLETEHERCACMISCYLCSWLHPRHQFAAEHFAVKGLSPLTSTSC